MNLYSVGYNHKHDKNFFMNMSGGVGSWLMLLMKTPAIFNIDNQETITKANSFILISKGTSHYYKAYENEYIDDWFYFDAPDEFISELKIPINKVTWLGDISELSSVIQNMTYEFYTSNSYSSKMASLYIEMYLIILSRKLENGLNTPILLNSSKNEKLTNLRINIYTNFQYDLTVDEMAEELSMSISNLQHSYKNMFGVTITNDIIESKLTRVKHFLSNTTLSIREIAELCGYSSEFYLMKQFKKRYNQTATEYRETMI